MPQTRINCPNCRQPLLADVEQLFDVSADPSVKQKLLSGAVNVAQCGNCGYRGSLATPIVYHDADKELLLTFFPPEVGMRRDDQEKMIGPLINQVINRLPMEKRKGYLLRPQGMLTFQGLVERILEADGITKEMLQAQQQRLAVLQRLLGVTAEDVRAEIIRQEDRLIDGDFFSMLNRVAEAAMMNEDRQGIARLSELQKSLLANSSFGKKVEEQNREVQAAMASLQELGEGLTREKLLELIITAPNEIRMSALVSMARAGLDYTFFQLLSEHIDNAAGEEKARLSALRERIVELTRQVDEQMEARAAQSRQLLEAILKAPDITQATMESLQVIDEFFLRELNGRYEQARKAGDLDAIGRLQKVVEVINQASAPPPEVGLLEALIDAPDEAGRMKILEENSDQITPELLSALNNIAAQVEQSEDKELAGRVRDVAREVRRFSMMKSMRG